MSHIMSLAKECFALVNVNYTWQHLEVIYCMQHDVSTNAWQPAGWREGPLKATRAALNEAINPAVDLM